MLFARLFASRDSQSEFADEAPEGMKSWQGGNHPPADWDKKKLCLRRNGACALGLDWRHHQPGHHRHEYDIVAYTPIHHDPRA